MCTYSTYIPPRVYLYQSADERLKSRLDQEKKDAHQTLKKEGSYSLPPSAERERPKDPNRHIPPTFILPRVCSCCSFEVRLEERK